MKVRVGKQTGKKYQHLVPSQVETTSNFGFLQPSYCRECAAQDTIDIRIASAVRLQPVVKPTFGRLFLKHYTSFVPYSDLWHAWDSFRSGKSYSGAIQSYIPTEAPSVPISLLTWMTYMCSEMQIIQSNLIGVYSNGTVNVPKGSLDIIGSAPTVAQLESIADYITANASFSSNIYKNVIYRSASYRTGHIGLYSDFLGTCDWYIYMPGSTKTLLCGRFTERGRNLRKILIGTGLQLSLEHDFVHVLNIASYFKVWFDLFAIQRETTWKDTSLHGWLEYIEQSGYQMMDFLSGSSSKVSLFYDWFYQSLPKCYYTQNPDYVSAHITGTAVSQAPTEFNLLHEGGEDIVEDVVSATSGNQPIVSGEIGQNTLDILKKMYQRVNIATAVGGKIGEFMRAIFGSDYKQENESYFLGSSTMQIEISDVMSTAVTESGYLGEYAGKGYGQDPGENLHYTCPEAGCVISIFALVPDARMAQGVDPNLFHRYKEDFFDPTFDALTLLPTRKLAIYGTFDLRSTLPVGNGESFGNIPNFSEYKVGRNTINGDMSLRSTRASLLPFSMQKLLPYTDVIEGDNNFVISNGLIPSVLVAGDFWRYIGLFRWYGNFDRIFVNSGVVYDAEEGIDEDWYLDFPGNRLDDNFVCYIYNDVRVTGYELPMADSFQTDPFKDHLTVEKA